MPAVNRVEERVRMETKSTYGSGWTNNAPFVFVDLRDSSNWETVETLLAEDQRTPAEPIPERIADRPVMRGH